MRSTGWHLKARENTVSHPGSPRQPCRGALPIPASPRPLSWSQSGVLRCPQLSWAQTFRKKLETHGKILSDLKFGHEGVLAGIKQRGRGQASCSSSGAPLPHNSALSTPAPQQPRDRGMGRDTQQALGALIAVTTEQLQVITNSRLPTALLGLARVQNGAGSVCPCTRVCTHVSVCAH